MKKCGLGGMKDFFPKEVSFGTPHSAYCDCDVCLKCDEIFNKLLPVFKDSTSKKVKTSEAHKICNHLTVELLDSLNCVNGDSYKELTDAYRKFWDEQVEGKTFNNVRVDHDDSCSCLVCSAKEDLVCKLKEFCSTQTVDSDILEIIDEQQLDQASDDGETFAKNEDGKTSKNVNADYARYLVCEPHNPVIITTKEQCVESVVDAKSFNEILPSKMSPKSEPEAAKVVKMDERTAEENNGPDSEIISKIQNLNVSQETKIAALKFQNASLKSIDFDELIDMCLCEPGKLGPYCLKHSVAYCQHMEAKLYSEGCTCTPDVECALCQRLKCNYCQHERSKTPLCPFMDDDETDEISDKLSSWLDEKLLEAGVAPEIIEKLSDPKKTSSENRKRNESVVNDVEICDQLAKNLESSVLESQIWRCNQVDTNFTITDKMKSQILNMNDLFDVRPFPRCYRLKGVKNSEGAYTNIEEEYMSIGYEAWKVPTQYIEETFPISSPVPDLDSRFEKEEEIRKKTKCQKLTPNRKKVKITGLNADWRPTVEICSDNSDYQDTLTTEEKTAWAQKTFDEIMKNCEDIWDQEPEENEAWSCVQPVLDRYCEEVVEESVDQQSFDDITLDEYIENEYNSVKVVLDKFKKSDIGYKEEFWNGFENWKPDKSENEVRMRLVSEAKKFSKGLDSFKNDYERVLSENPLCQVDADTSLHSVIESLPAELADKVNKLRKDLPPDWLADPSSALLEFENKPHLADALKSNSLTLDKIPETVWPAETAQDSADEIDDDLNVSVATTLEPFFYDDEELSDEGKDTTETVQPPQGKDTTAEELPKEDLQKTQSSWKVAHTPAPYIVKLKEEMLKRNPGGLHPTQRVWYDRPMFPYWTPTVIYDLSEIEKQFFDGVEEYSPDIDADKLDELERTLLGTTVSVGEPDGTLDSCSVAEGKQSNDNIDVTDCAVETGKVSFERADVEEKGGVDEVSDELVRTSSSIDDGCLIKEDDFRAFELLIKAQALKEKNAKKDDCDDNGGALSLEQILEKEIAGPVKTNIEGAVELDTTADISLESVVPSPAYKYPFKLDTFQKQAIIALEAGLNVFVAAHTSAGKTVAAEYAIAMAGRNGSKVIYTSPIKALSNQKYKDFSTKFKGEISVGIITGDVQLNEEASCLVMTTEILRSMLYNQSSHMHDLEFVIFDEVHYFNDPERGNVWEEVLILLPRQCQLVMLSATVPDVMSFASWVGTLKQRTVIVTSTKYRPVPLKHYIHVSPYTRSVNISLEVKAGEGPFLDKNYYDAMKLKKNVNKISDPRKRQKIEWENFITHHLVARKRLPTVVFLFSRLRCDELATCLNTIDLTTKDDKNLIKNIFTRQINRLQPEDRDIQQIIMMQGLLMKGIGVHHSGILPILKEIIEILFQKSHIKLLFATETFAMGVNMPAKTVVFQKVSKFDGKEIRELKPAEYTQMAGRAGRRGTDKSGTVIITDWGANKQCKDDPSSGLRILKEMLTGKVDPLESQFRLRYSMILTALKPEGEFSINSIIKKSFLHYSHKDEKTEIEKLTEKGDDDLRKATEEMRTIPNNLRNTLLEYCQITCQFFSHHVNIRDKMIDHRAFRDYLQIGRMVTISYGRYANVFGIIVGVDRQTFDVVVMRYSQSTISSLTEKYPEATVEQDEDWFRVAGMRQVELSTYMDQAAGHHWMENRHTLDLLPCKATNILKIVKNCSIKLNRNASQQIIESVRSKRYYNTNVDGFIQLFNDSLCNVHNFVYLEEETIRFNQPDIKLEVMKYHKLTRALAENLVNIKLPFLPHQQLVNYMQICFWWIELKRLSDKRKVQAQKEKLQSLFEDFKSKLEFLKFYKYIKEEDDVVHTKGRIASRMTNFEVFVTEILLKNVLKDLDGAETAALLSCLVILGVSTDTNGDSSNNSDANPLFLCLSEDDANENEVEVSTTKGKNKFHKNQMRDINKKFKAMTNKSNGGKEEILEKISSIKDFLRLPPALVEASKVVNEIRKELLNKEMELGISPMEGADLNTITFYLMPVVYAWANGTPMKKIKSVLQPKIQEGILVRWILNLIETIKDIDSATHHLFPDPSLKLKLEQASSLIKHGIVYTQSIYLNQPEY